MPKVDFTKIGDIAEYAPLPEGEYPCRLTQVEQTQTRNGDDLWRLRFVVTAGEFTGRYIFDNLVFSPKALPRVKLLCNRLGVDVNGEVDLRPDHLLQRQCLVTVAIEEYADEEGATKKRNRVPFAGYEAVAAETEDDGDEHLPF